MRSLRLIFRNSVEPATSISFVLPSFWVMLSRLGSGNPYSCTLSYGMSRILLNPPEPFSWMNRRRWLHRMM